VFRIRISRWFEFYCATYLGTNSRVQHLIFSGVGGDMLQLLVLYNGSVASGDAPPTVSPFSPGSGSSSNGGAIASGTVGRITVVGGFRLAAWAIKRRQYQEQPQQAIIRVDNSPQRNSGTHEMNGNDPQWNLGV
jgi:hypothetical protein